MPLTIFRRNAENLITVKPHNNSAADFKKVLNISVNHLLCFAEISFGHFILNGICGFLVTIHPHHAYCALPGYSDQQAG